MRVHHYSFSFGVFCPPIARHCYCCCCSCLAHDQVLWWLKMVYLCCCWCCCCGVMMMRVSIVAAMDDGGDDRWKSEQQSLMSLLSPDARMSGVNDCSMAMATGQEVVDSDDADNEIVNCWWKQSVRNGGAFFSLDDCCCLGPTRKCFRNGENVKKVGLTNLFRVGETKTKRGKLSKSKNFVFTIRVYNNHASTEQHSSSSLLVAHSWQQQQASMHHHSTTHLDPLLNNIYTCYHHHSQIHPAICNFWCFLLLLLRFPFTWEGNCWFFIQKATTSATRGQRSRTTATTTKTKAFHTEAHPRNQHHRSGGICCTVRSELLHDARVELW